MTTNAVPPVSTPSRPGVNVLAIVAFILGLAGGSIFAVAIGHLSLGQIKRSHESGRALAIIGLVLGYLEFAAIIVFGVVLFVASAAGHLVVD